MNLAFRTDYPSPRDSGPADLEIACRRRDARIGGLAQNPADHRRHFLMLNRAHSFPLCTGWRKRVGFPPFGETPKTTAARNTTA